uniref:Uncharacterized protein n=1 Tax=Chromera velia CCMP2878 TaxID=1169474 RepID=A0A0G4HI47_9ALVE|eukprot:Cvel_27773.t1-p1 / transcript=Cvel_27773.t1 / gene=Cvel_27773 / organism=Chromera_velia_CCMP2878 / gene_product=hypothetical protein / transcript_product=hypothetical protein / location=Cvel_scaffold3522:2771-3073(+) / protein_length=101 / sequence_SO=supercontig / SO=protein_coding / is_pseudo=false
MPAERETSSSPIVSPLLDPPAHELREATVGAVWPSCRILFTTLRLRFDLSDVWLVAMGRGESLPRGSGGAPTDAVGGPVRQPRVARLMRPLAKALKTQVLE